MLHSRDRRLAEAIRRVLSETFQHEIKDPRLPSIVTIRHVELAKDMRNATIYYSILPDDKKSRDKMDDLLGDSVGYLRSQVAREVNAQHTPTLHFRYDPSESQYQRINTLLHENLKPESEEAEGEEKE